MASRYTVNCTCGRTHEVSAGDAGTRLPCGCGSSFEVPELAALRRAAGEATGSPELAIETMLRDGHQPAEAECLCCGAATADVAHVRIRCERAETRAGGWSWNPIGLLAGFLVFQSSETHDRGRNVDYRVPVRICSRCAAGASRSQVRDAVRKVDALRRLLDKYPHASVSKAEC